MRRSLVLVAAAVVLSVPGCGDSATEPIAPAELRAPTLSTLNPAAGVRGSTVAVTLTGLDFIEGTTVAVSGGDVTVRNVAVQNVPPGTNSALTAELVIGADAAVGNRSVTVATAAGSSNELPFTIRHAAPTLATVSPAVGVRGTTVDVTLTGTNFVSGETTVAVSGSGISITNVAVTSRTQLTAKFAVAGDAAIGSRNVSVTTPGGTSAAVAFVVNPVTPTLTAVAPASGVQGTTVSATLTGADFIVGGTTVAVSGSDVTVSNVSVSSATSLTADFAVGGSAALGDRDVTLTTAGGTSGAKAFTVIPPAPTLTSVSPTTGVQGTTVSVTLTGTNFVTGGTTVSVSGSNVTVKNVSVASATSLTADFEIGSSAALGDRNVTVTTAGGTTAAKIFTVNPPAPTLTAISPTKGVQSTTVSVTLTGTNFVSGASVSVSGSGVTVSNVTVVSGTSITADFAVASSAALGDRNVTVTTSGGTTGAKTFTINPPAPTLTSISPTTGVQNTTVSMTLTGTNFVSGASVSVSGSGVTVSNVTVVSSTSITASFAVSSSAALGDRNVTVTTSGGTTGAKTFTINPPAPTLTSISPTTGVQNTTVSMTLTGTNFVSGASVSVSGSGVTVSNVTVVSSTSITASFAVSSSAALGDRNVTVTTSGGTTGAKTFTVNPPAPTLTSISPTTGVQSTTVSMTLTGTNFVSGASVSVSGTGVTVSNVTVVSGTSITADFAVSSTASLGDRNVTVTTSGGTTAAKTFTVNPPAPTLTSISPTSGTQGTTVSVTLTGTNFVSGASVAVSGSGVTVSNVTVVSSTSITASFVISASAATGARNVTVTTSGGTSAARTFTVNAAGEPQEVPITP